MGEKKIDTSRFILRASDIRELPKIFGFKTGIPGLDNMFWTVEWKDDKPVKKPLGGIPSYSVVNLTGTPDTGKSLIAQIYTVKQASLGYPVAFVTVETPAEFVVVSLKERAKAMGVAWEEVEDKIWLIDAATYSILREDLPALLDTLADTIRQGKTKSVVIDSITGLFEDKEMKARSIVRDVYNFLKKWHQTAILVNQKRSGHDPLSPEAAGGFAVAHISDVNIVLWKIMVSKQWEARLYGAPIGDLVRFIRIDGCRVSGHDTRAHFLKITELGLVEIGPAVDERQPAEDGEH